MAAIPNTPVFQVDILIFTSSREGSWSEVVVGERLAATKSCEIENFDF